MKKILLSMILMIIIIATIGVSIVIAATTTGVVNTVTVNLREEPDTSSKILIQVGEEKEVTILGETGDWYEVEYDGVTGYISKSFLDVESEENIPVTSTETEETDDTDDEEDLENVSTTAVETEPEETADNTDTNATDDETVIEDNTSDSDLETYSVITISEDTDIRLLPSITSSKTNTIESGSTVTVLITLNNWVKITDGSYSGWTVKTNLN